MCKVQDKDMFYNPHLNSSRIGGFMNMFVKIIKAYKKLGKYIQNS